MSPQLARRTAIIGTLALGLFAILFFRLWFLQVLSTNQYAKAASVNFVRDVVVQAPRGEILDSTGQIMASSRRAYAVEVSPPHLPVPITDANLAHPPQPDAALYVRLSRVLGLPTNRQPCPVNGHGLLRMSEFACRVVQGYVQLSYGEATVASDITPQQLWYISERQAEFPGVSVQQIYQRTYPFGDVASQVLGIVSRITHSETVDSYYKGVNENDSVGQSGLEASYDRYLRGVDGVEKVKVDAFGNFVGVQSETPPVPGDYLKLSLNSKLEEVGQQALQESIDTNYPANGGAFVALNPENGEVYAMGSLPTYNANVFTKPVPYSTYNSLFGPNSGDPQVNRAYQSAGPTGSTFKPITATAALESGVWSVGSIFDDSGQYCFSGQCRHNAGGAVDGSLDLVNAIKVSSDDFFYNLGVLTNSPAPKVARSSTGRASTESARRPASTCPTRSRGPCRTPPGARSATSSSPSATARRARSNTPTARAPARRSCRAGTGARSTRQEAAGSPTAPTGSGRPATTKTWRLARVTCRSRRCSSRWCTRRWPTTAQS